MTDYRSATDIVREFNPAVPVFCRRPHAARTAARWFTTNFPGKCLYAVKANPSRWLLNALVEGGITHFDVASIQEVRDLRRFAPEAVLAFMHPIKSPEAIHEAYFEHGVRIFSLDSHDELDKILAATDRARDLSLFVRLRMNAGGALIPLGAKFGVEAADEASLLQRTRQKAERLGICFHVGSQSMLPEAFTSALRQVSKAVIRAGVLPDIVDIGGGFPAPYPGMMPPPLQHYIEAIDTEVEEELLVTDTCEIWCEPGRALSAEAASLIVRVEHRRGQLLHINDGVYGALADAGPLGWVYPARLLGASDGAEREPAEFSFYGPTCDDHDFMRGPFLLPDRIRSGDHIELGNMGAYGAVMRTNFNGYSDQLEFTVADQPMLSLYGEAETGPRAEPARREAPTGRQQSHD